VLIVRAISFQDFQPVCSGSANVTDRQTTCNLNTPAQAADIRIHFIFLASKGTGVHFPTNDH